MREACAALQGRHDYTSFCHEEEAGNDNVLCVERIALSIVPGSSPLADPEAPALGEVRPEWREPMLLAIDFVSHGFRSVPIPPPASLSVRLGNGRMVRVCLAAGCTWCGTWSG